MTESGKTQSDSCLGPRGVTCICEEKVTLNAKSYPRHGKQGQQLRGIGGEVWRGLERRSPRLTFSLFDKYYRRLVK